MLRGRGAGGLGPPRGHWWPAPATEINSTVCPSAHPAVWVVTSPAVVELGCPQPSMPRHVALTACTEGPSTRAVPSEENALPGPPLYGTLSSAVPCICSTDVGRAPEQSVSSVPATGAIAANVLVWQPRRSAIMAPFDMP